MSNSKKKENGCFNKPNEIILYDSKNEKITNFTKLFSLIPIIQGILVYSFAFFSFCLLIFTQSLTLVSIYILILIYQFLFCKRNENWRKLLKFFKPQLYFRNFKLIAEEELKEKECLFTFHPHGVLSVVPPTVFSVNETFFKSKYLVSRVLLNFPLSGAFAKLLGGEAVDKNNFVNIMKKGENIVFMPGGFEEATITDFNKNKIYIKKRLGFIKYALDFGYSVQPCYAFNENKLFYNITYFEKFRLFLNKIKFPGVIFCSKLGFFPHNDIDITVVVGKKIDIPKIKNPTDTDVLKYHKIYMDSLIDLYYRNTNKYGDGGELIIY
jgi:hypothetical protein